MKLLPFENITYKTSLKEDEVIKRLEEKVDQEPGLKFGLVKKKNANKYHGSIVKQTFDIYRIISYRNSFLPRITGIVENDFDGTSIRVKMRMHVFVNIFLCSWFGLIGYGLVLSFIQMNEKPDFDSSIFITLFGLLLFAYALTLGAFKYESNKSKKDLKQLFEADIVEE